MTLEQPWQALTVQAKQMQQKEVQNHYNEYSEFHLRETEAHILASFMEMMGMKNLEGKVTPVPTVPMGGR